MGAAQRIQKWVWILIYGGMFLLGVGLAVRRSDAALGWGIAVPGAFLIAAGALLIWARSRMKDNPEATP